MNIGILGLGNMGAGMAATLRSKDFTVYGFDLLALAISKAQERGIKPIKNLNEPIDNMDVLMMSLAQAQHVEAVILGGNGILTHAHAELIVIDTATSTAEMSPKVAAELAEKNIYFADSPVSGGPRSAAIASMSMVLWVDESGCTFRC